jgi:carbonic anhydrase
MVERLTRRAFTARLAGLAGGFGVVAGLDTTAAAAGELATSPPKTPDEALAALLKGNQRWVKGKAIHPHQSIARRKALANGQRPFATVLSCIDSRVPPELVFDRGLGDIFAVRTGAQAVDEVVLGSVEYGPVELGTPLVFVLGHERCGAVKAAIDVIRGGGHAPGHIDALVSALRPAYRFAVGQSGDLLDNMVRAQTMLTVARLKADRALAERVREGKLAIVGGRYDLVTGAVEVLG